MLYSSTLCVLTIYFFVKKEIALFNSAYLLPSRDTQGSFNPQKSSICGKTLHFYLINNIDQALNIVKMCFTLIALFIFYLERTVHNKKRKYTTSVVSF